MTVRDVLPTPRTEFERQGFADYANNVTRTTSGLTPDDPEFAEWQRGWALGYLAKDAADTSRGKELA